MDSEPPEEQIAQLAAWGEDLRAMAALGLLYCTDDYDRERYERIGAIAERMLAAATGQPVAAVHERLAAELGYVTVKVGVAAAVFDAEGRQLLVQRADNGLWAQPGGWADVGDSPAAMTTRETREETGLAVRVERLVGLYDSRKRGFRHAHHIYHVVFLCSVMGGTPTVTPEIRALGWYAPEALPPLSPGHRHPVRDAFDRWAEPDLPAVFD